MLLCSTFIKGAVHCFLPCAVNCAFFKPAGVGVSFGANGSISQPELVRVNPLSPSIKVHILLSALHTFVMVLVERI